MKVRFIIAAIVISWYLPVYPLFLPGENTRLKIFYSQNEKTGWDALLKGKITLFTSKDDLDKNDVYGRALDKTRATVRLYDREGIREGQYLYVIDINNLVVARMKVRNIIKSESFGFMLVGEGNFRMASIDSRVVQKLEDEYSKYAYIYKSRGDYFREVDETGNAITEYKKAIELDSGNPEAHLALGAMYLKQDLLQFAFKEYSESYKNIARMYDNEDKYLLLRGMAEIRYREVYSTDLPAKFRERYRKEGVRYCKEALGYYRDSVEMNFLLGMFHYTRTPSDVPDDRIAKNYFIKTTDLHPEHVQANIALSELYFKYKNIEKARVYIERALKADPDNTKALNQLRYIQTFSK